MRLNAHFDMLPERAFQKRGFGRAPATLEGGKGGGGAPLPDPNIGRAQLMLAELSKEYLQQWKTEVWPMLKETTLKQDARADEQFALDKEMQVKQMKAADTALEEYQTKGAPLRAALYKEAMEAGGEADVNKQSALALGDVKSQFGLTGEANKRQMMAYGIDPTSGKFQSANRQTGIMEAATSAAAQTKARDAATQLGWAKKMDAAALAQGQFSNQASSTGLALTAGSQALNAGQTTMGNASAMGSSMGGAYGGAMSGWGQVGQLGVQKYNADINAYNATTSANAANNSALGSTLGALAGAGAYYMKPGSDIRLKKNIKSVGKLDNGLTIYEFEYKDEFKDHPACGNGVYRGVMAQEVEKLIPEAVFTLDNGYKAVNYEMVV